MGKGKSQTKTGSKPGKADKSGKPGKSDTSVKVVAKLPKTKCCESKSKCGRCPLRMLKEGTLPPGYTVKRRVLVRVDGKKVSKKKLTEAA